MALAPLVFPTYGMTLLTEALILGLFAMSLDLMVGYTRLVSFGHAAAYGFGAYACGWLLLHTSLPMLAAIPLAALLAGVIAIGVAWVCTQATGVSFSMLTSLSPALCSLLQMDQRLAARTARGTAPSAPWPACRALPARHDTLLIVLLGASACRIGAPFGAVLRGIRGGQ